MRSRIPELRAARSLTQQQLADLAGVKQVTISKLENHPGAGDPATLSAVAEALGVRVDELTSDEPLRTDHSASGRPSMAAVPGWAVDGRGARVGRRA